MIIEKKFEGSALPKGALRYLQNVIDKVNLLLMEGQDDAIDIIMNTYISIARLNEKQYNEYYDIVAHAVGLM